MRTDYLNPQLYNRLYSCMTYSNVLALRISLETGLRIDDVLSLRFEDLKGRTLRGIAEKTDKPFKKTISLDLANRLKRMGHSGYIFPHRTKPNEHRTRQAVWSNMKKAARQLGVDVNAAPHSARKTYAVEVFNDKGIEVAKRELQHDRLSTTVLYCFSNMLSCQEQQRKTFDLKEIDTICELIAEKVVKKLQENKKTS